MIKETLPNCISQTQKKQRSATPYFFSTRFCSNFNLFLFWFSNNVGELPRRGECSIALSSWSRPPNSLSVVGVDATNFALLHARVRPQTWLSLWDGQDRPRSAISASAKIDGKMRRSRGCNTLM